MNGKGECTILGDIKRNMHFYVGGFLMHKVDSSKFWLNHFGPKLVVGMGEFF